MFRPTALAAALAPALLLATTAAAQCQFTGIAVQSYGTFCNTGPTGCCAIVSSPTTLSFGLDVTSCALAVEVNALEGCCGVAVLARVVAFGSSQAAVPVPQFGPGCTLWVQPVEFRDQGSALAQIPLPPTLPPGIQFFAQAGALILNPFPAPNLVVTLSHGQAVTLQ